jgi:UDP-N-acetylglucosamine 2-epimerase
VRRLLEGCENIRLLPPLDYVTMAHLLQRSYFVLTDSGGIQEEAPSLGTPALVLRDMTEREEGLAEGVARLVGTDPERIVTEAKRLLDDPTHYERMARPVRVYGDGHASSRIVAALKTAAARLH